MFALAFWAGTNVAWLMVVMVGFNLFFSPLVPLTDALANTAKTDNHGLRSGATVGIRGLCDRLCVDRQTGEPVRLSGDLVLLSLGAASMLLGMMIRPSVQPAGENRQQESAGWPARRALITQSWRFLACVSLLQGAHAAYYGFSAIYWQSAGYSASAVGYLWSLGVVAEVIILRSATSCSAVLALAIFCCFPPFAAWRVGG